MNYGLNHFAAYEIHCKLSRDISNDLSRNPIVDTDRERMYGRERGGEREKGIKLRGFEN